MYCLLLESSDMENIFKKTLANRLNCHVSLMRKWIIQPQLEQSWISGFYKFSTGFVFSSKQRAKFSLFSALKSYCSNQFFSILIEFLIQKQ